MKIVIQIGPSALSLVFIFSISTAPQQIPTGQALRAEIFDDLESHENYY